MKLLIFFLQLKKLFIFCFINWKFVVSIDRLPVSATSASRVGQHAARSRRHCGETGNSKRSNWCRSLNLDSHTSHPPPPKVLQFLLPPNAPLNKQQNSHMKRLLQCDQSTNTIRTPALPVECTRESGLWDCSAKRIKNAAWWFFIVRPLALNLKRWCVLFEMAHSPGPCSHILMMEEGGWWGGEGGKRVNFKVWNFGQKWFFWVYERRRDFLGREKKNRGIFGGCDKRTKGFLWVC